MIGRLRAALPHGGSLPDADWRQRHTLIVALLGLTIAIVPVYAVLAHGRNAIHYLPELVALVAFLAVARWREPTSRVRAIAASLGLLAASASLIDISGGLLEMHFTFFVVIVVLTLYEDWVPFLIAVGFVLLHHGVMGTLDPRAVFNEPAAWRDPWLYAGIHAMFVGLAGVAGVVAWGLNERVRDRMRAAQAELVRISLTDQLTGLSNRRSLMSDLESACLEKDTALLAIFDLDGFKDYNDQFGHPGGDALLARLAGNLSHAVGDHGKGFSITAPAGKALLPAEGVRPSEALTICDGRMYRHKNRRRASAAVQVRDVLLTALTARDADLGQHVDSVAVWSERLGIELGLGRAELRELRFAAELHDIGKIAIPDSIVSKPGPLDDAEFEFIRNHTIIGERIISASPALAGVGRIVRATHERFDGGGYPDRIAGDEIPLGARIIAVCDVYDAMVSERPYRETITPGRACEELWRCSGTQFDPIVVEAFTTLAAVLDPPDRASLDRAPAVT